MAASMYAAAAREAASSTPIQIECAEGLARNGKRGDAAELLSQRLRMAPDDTDVLETLGTLLILDGHEAMAVQILSKALTIKPRDVRAMVDKAVALDVLGQHEAAQSLYRDALAVSPGDPATNNDLALSLMLAGRRDDASQVLRPFRDMPDLPDRIRINLEILDAASGTAVPSDSHHVGAANMRTLTRALPGASAATDDPPKAPRRPLQEQLAILAPYPVAATHRRHHGASHRPKATKPPHRHATAKNAPP